MQRVYVQRLLRLSEVERYPLEWLDEPWRRVVSALERTIEQWDADELAIVSASATYADDHAWTRDELAVLNAWQQDVSWCLGLAAGDKGLVETVADVQQLLSNTPGAPRFRSLAELEHLLPEPVWLWANWIPRGMLTVLGGFQGTGKSMFTMELARTVIGGGVWPDGSPVERRGNVVYIDAEGIPQENAKRARALGVDRSQLYLLYASEGQMLDLTDRSWRDQVIELVAAQRPELVIVDSLSSAASSGQDRPEQVNPLLMFLAGMARRHDCGVVLLHHLRKPQGQQMAFPLVTIHDFAGSRHITAMARSVLGLSVMQGGSKGFTLNGPRRLDLCKTNVADEYPQPIGLALVTVSDGGKRFQFGEAPSAEGTPARDECADWLRDLLADGPMRLRDILNVATDAGYTKSMVWRARNTMGDVVDTKGKQHPKNQWALAAWKELADEDADNED